MGQWTNYGAVVSLGVIFSAFVGISFAHQSDSGKTCQPTSPDVVGPYYYPDAPYRSQICRRDPAFHHVMHLLVQGRVLDENCDPLPHARVEIWQADHGGHYLFRENCRGYLFTGQNGDYVFLTIHPGKYTLAPGTNLFRPAHVHFMVKKHGYETLVTQMYFHGDSNLGLNDSCSTCSSDKSDLIVDPEILCADATGHHCYALVTFDMVLRQGQGYAVVKDTDDNSVELYDLIDRG